MKDKDLFVRGRWFSRPLAVATAAAMVVAPVVLSSTAAVADTRTSTADSAAHGHWLWAEGLGLDVVGAAYTQSEFGTTPGPVTDPLNVSVLGGLASLNVGTISLPLIKPSENDPGLLHLGNLGAISSYAASPSATESTASSGLINADGSLNIDGATNGGYDVATLDASDLLAQLIGPTAAGQLLDEASVGIGVLGSQTSVKTGVVDSEYMLTELDLNVHSPAVGGLVNTVDGSLQTLLKPLQDLLGPGGGINTVLSGLVNTIGALPLVNAKLNEASIDTKPLFDEVRRVLVETPLSNQDGSVFIDLSSGTISVDLGSLVVDRTGATGLNSLPANTEVLHGDTVNAILDGVTDALTGAGPNSLLSKVVDVVETGIYDIGVHVSVQADISLPGLPPLLQPRKLVDAPVTIDGTLGGFVKAPGHTAPVPDVSQINVADIPIGLVLQPITNALTSTVTSMTGALAPVVTTILGTLQPTVMGIVSPIVTDLLTNGLGPVLRGVANITINHQPTEAPFNAAGGDLGPGSVTTRGVC